jgi:SAM-dependent methyltransferase
MTVDPRSATGFASAVSAYERARPSYPVEALVKLFGELTLSESSSVLDLAAGTGKLTELLADFVGRVIAVEPSAEMLSALSAKLPAVEALGGTGDAIPLGDGAVDAVFVAEAFHWFATAAACREIRRVLTTGGGFALLWNRARWSEEELPWLPSFQALVTPIRLAAGEFPAAGETWKAIVHESGLFEPLSCEEVEHRHVLDVDGFVDLVASWSWIANLPDADRLALLDGVREMIAAPIVLRYATEIHWTRAV